MKDNNNIHINHVPENPRDMWKGLLSDKPSLSLLFLPLYFLIEATFIGFVIILSLNNLDIH